ncbi:MAG: hypothetical protein CL912_28815 [Deltaproteobacteria bacterium]|nr:hypothetical protein [Deltaproteobacteria bacterium]
MGTSSHLLCWNAAHEMIRQKTFHSPVRKSQNQDRQGKLMDEFYSAWYTGNMTALQYFVQKLNNTNADVQCA